MQKLWPHRLLQRIPRIVVIEKSMSRVEILGLIGACDAYVSLHRSEGMGIAEAMSLSELL